MTPHSPSGSGHEPAAPGSYQSPFDELIGAEVEQASAEGAVAAVAVAPNLHQPNGILHGGVLSTLVETTASVGSNLWLMEHRDDGTVAVGVSNHTDFLRSVSEGTIRAESRPIQRGRSLQLWQVTVTDGEARPVAHGTVKLMNIAAT